ncbi:MAG: hypothetical protein WC804_22030 [Sphingomonas sp.]|jgi:hypothetical protein
MIEKSNPMPVTRGGARRMERDRMPPDRDDGGKIFGATACWAR